MINLATRRALSPFGAGIAMSKAIAVKVPGARSNGSHMCARRRRPRDHGCRAGRLIEVAPGEDTVTVRGREASCACMADNQAIVSIRATSSIEANAAAPIPATNATLGVGRLAGLGSSPSSHP